MYPKDTVTRKQMDRQDDRQTRRIDLHRDRLDQLRIRVEKLEVLLKSFLREVVEKQ